MLPERCHQVFTLHFSEGMDTAATCCLLLSLGAVRAQDMGSLKVSVTQKWLEMVRTDCAGHAGNAKVGVFALRQ